jgi:hypothetical protein
LILGDIRPRENTRMTQGLPILILSAAMSLAPFAHAAAALTPVQEQQHLVVGPGFVRIEGATDANLAEALESAVDPKQRLERVELVNDGGDVDGVIAAAGWLRGRGVRRAVVVGQCASACAYMALLFPERELAPMGLMGFHDVHSSSGNQRAMAAGRRRLLRLFSANGISSSTAQALFSNQYLRWYTRRELLARHLITGCWDPVKSRRESCQPTRQAKARP